MIRVHEKSKKGGIQIKIKKEIKKLHSWKWVKKVICRELQPIKLCVWLSSVNHSNATRVCLRLLKQSERLILLNNTRFPPLVNMSQAARLCLLYQTKKSCWFSVWLLFSLFMRNHFPVKQKSHYSSSAVQMISETFVHVYA